MCKKHQFFILFFCTALLHEFSENPCFVFQQCLWQQWCQTLSLVAIHFEEGSNGTRLHIMTFLHLNPPAVVAHDWDFTQAKQRSAQVKLFYCNTWEGGSLLEANIMDRFPNPTGGHYACLSATFGEGPLRTTQETMRYSTQQWQSGRNGLNQSEDFGRKKGMLSASWSSVKFCNITV